MASGAHGVSASAAATLSKPSVVATGTFTTIGTGAAILPPLAANANGVHAPFVATGAAVLPTPIAAANGNVGVVGSASVVLAGLTAQALGSVHLAGDRFGTGAATLPGLMASAGRETKM